MGRGVGRPVAAVVLSEAERTYLERQVRRHRIARSLADRCRMILRCGRGRAEYGRRGGTRGA